MHRSPINFASPVKDGDRPKFLVNLQRTLALTQDFRGSIDLFGTGRAFSKTFGGPTGQAGRRFRIVLAAAVCVIASSLTAGAGYFPNRPMPNRPGCEITHCVPVWDGHTHRRRCYWRCPRMWAPPHYAAPAPIHRYEPQTATAANSDPSDPTQLLLIALGILTLVLIFGAASSPSSGIDKDVQDTETLAKKLNAAAREADERIAQFLKNARADDGGRHD